MVSTSLKIAFGYLLMICLLFGAIDYIYKQMILLTAPNELEENTESRKKTTYQIITQLYKAEVIGQTLRTGQLHEYASYKQSMQQVRTLLDSLQLMLTDTLQQARIDTVHSLLLNKERNMIAVLESMKEIPTDELYQQQLDSLIAQQDSILTNSHVHKRVVTHHNSYTIHHKPKKFFKRLADVFNPGKPDSSQVSSIMQEEYTDTIEEVYNPIDTIATMLTNIHNKVFQTRQENQRAFESRINRLRIASGRLGQRVNQLLETIEQEEQQAIAQRLQQEETIRKQAAWTMASIAMLAVLLVLIFLIIIYRDITRSNHYRKELEKSKLYAENLLATREKLMLTITHDIKAPTGSIIGYIDLLSQITPDKRQLFYLHNMKESAHHLLNLITSLLDYHRLEAGKMDVHSVSFSPHNLFENIYNSFLPIIEKKNIHFIFEEHIRQRLTLKGDSFRIRQIAENLLSNAQKFTSEGNITLRINYQNNLFSFSVSDTGCGMTQQEQERIFQAFTRLKNAQGQEGFGLGLSITQKLVELLNGSIKIESTPGKGSTFTITLPLRESKEQLANDLPSDNITTDIRILMIDDDRIQLNLTETMIHTLCNKQNSDKSPTIYCCQTKEEVFNLLKTTSFDLILTDIQMPGMNGFELLNALRYSGIPGINEIPVVAITARSDMNESDFRAKGFAGCLFKPFCAK
ncbi:MAG TPA: hybrid sensor histidine kinase/response regulator, partial [Candidatus Phocaeicola gallistercoris]|nr:hybrid sensor histidine kinase/response regulator [Candidatus Phocaeicola gallistercoris]